MDDDVVFWNVDTQYDFVDPEGKLPVGEDQEGAREIEDELRQVTQIARDNDIRVVNTADWHNENTEELSEEPDFKETFPPHCMAGTSGAEYIGATEPENPLYIAWSDDFSSEQLEDHEGDLVIYKDAFDVFAGESESPHADDILNNLDPDVAVVYGVATDVCVDYAVEGLLERDMDVYVVDDAVKGIDPGYSDEVLASWSENGAELGSVEELEDYLEEV